MLASASIGAVWSSTSPDFGAQGVLDRFKQISPKVLVSTTAVRYNGKVHNHVPKLKSIVDGLETLQIIILFPFVEPVTANDAHSISPKCILSTDFVKKFALGSPEYVRLPFSHPLLIVFSSGTTGAPKCIVHSHGVLAFFN